jgi:hypothetical protein
MILSPAERAQAYTYAADLVEDKQHTQFANVALRQFLGYFHTDMSLPLEHYFPELPKMDDPQVWYSVEGRVAAFRKAAVETLKNV